MPDVRTECPLTTIILLTAQGWGERLSATLFAHDASLNVVVVETLEELEAVPAAVLAFSRLVAFCSRCIVPVDILDAVGFGSYNFHPGPPNYPGWGSFNFAIYRDEKVFGVTLHEMLEKVDSGPIVGFDFFLVEGGSDVMALMRQTMASMFSLFDIMAPALVSPTELLKLPLSWATAKTSRKTFAGLCEIPPDITETELRRRVKAFGLGDGYTKPHMQVAGRTYWLDEEQKGSTTNAQIVLHGVTFVSEVAQTDVIDCADEIQPQKRSAGGR